MNEVSDSQSDGLHYCPICQAPLKNLKIPFSHHINMCDINWDELEECKDGVSCKNKSIFHYRDYSHQVLATYRENVLVKRKREDEKSEMTTSKKPKQKENRTVAKRRSTKVIRPPAEESEDDIFMEPSESKRNHLKTPTKSKRTPSPKTKADKIIKSDSPPPRIEPEQSTSANKDSDVPQNVKIEEMLDCIKSDWNSSDDSNDKVEENLSNEDSSADNQSEPDSQELVVSQSIDKACQKKDECKAKWNNIFGTKSKQETVETPKVNSKFNKKASNKFSNKSETKQPKVCPYFKKLPGTGFAVDAFQYGSIPEVDVYFLSHFHSDHYIGLKKSFAHPLYCSLITANLVKKKLRVDEKYIRILELNQPVVINQVEVTSFDANHCPGSLIILFRLLNGEQYLHVGDFRASPEMEEEPELRSAQITRLYLDTTYFDPQYVFPSQKEVIDRVKKIVREMSSKYPKALFISGSYLIGKEKVFLGILDVLKCKLWAQPHKRDVFKCINDEIILSALTDQAKEAQLHVLPMNYFRFDRLQKHLQESGSFSHIFAFKPTGWEMGRTKVSDWINTTTYKNMTIYGVPYSEHSNYEELCRFIKFVKADKVIPTVTLRNREMYSHLKQIVDSYKNDIKMNKPKQQSISQYMTQTKL